MFNNTCTGTEYGAVGADPQVVMPVQILVVDDEAPIRELVSDILLQHGYRVLVAQDGVEAISTAQREQPALVILDYLLPGMDGVDVCRILKQGPTTSQIKLIMLSVMIDWTARQRALVVGADGYLIKPFSNADLLEMIEGVLGSASD